MSTRQHYCKKCDRETDQFKQMNLSFDADGENYVWFCRSCNKKVAEISQKELKDIFRRKNLGNLIGHVAQYFTIEVADIRSNSKSPSIVIAKHIFSYLSQYFEYGSTREVGNFIGRPHNAIQLGNTTIAHKIGVCPETTKKVNALRSIIRRTDKVMLFRTILQETPTEKLPQLIDYINDFKKLK